MFKKKLRERAFSEKVERRVNKLSTDVLSMWAEQALNEISKCLRSYEKSGEKLYLEEALNGAEALHAVVYSLAKRSNKFW